MTSQAGQQIMTVQVLPNISRSKGNQVIKFGHLKKYSMRSIFLEKLSRKLGSETISRPFLFFKKALR